MPKINEYINQKPIEVFYEIKNEKDYQVPSFEEFMETYQGDEKVNYSDLENGSVSVDEVKGYGPCSTCGSPHLTFKLGMVLHCWNKTEGTTVYNTDRAREEATDILGERGPWADGPISYFSMPNRRRLADRINAAIDDHINRRQNINKTVSSYKDD